MYFSLYFSQDKQAGREELLAIDLADKNAYGRKAYFSKLSNSSAVICVLEA